VNEWPGVNSPTPGVVLMRAAVEHLWAFYPHLKRVTKAIEYGKLYFTTGLFCFKIIRIKVFSVLLATPCRNPTEPNFHLTFLSGKDFPVLHYWSLFKQKSCGIRLQWSIYWLQAVIPNLGYVGPIISNLLNPETYKWLHCNPLS